jgi:hypothetical protein
VALDFRGHRELTKRSGPTDGPRDRDVRAHELLIRAQAARSYSWMSPPNKGRRRTCTSSVGQGPGSGCGSGVLRSSVGYANSSRGLSPSLKLPAFLLSGLFSGDRGPLVRKQERRCEDVCRGKLGSMTEVRAGNGRTHCCCFGTGHVEPGIGLEALWT